MRPTTEQELDDFVRSKVQECAPAPLVVSDTALQQLRPVFAELFALTLAARRACVRVEGIVQ